MFGFRNFINEDKRFSNSKVVGKRLIISLFRKAVNDAISKLDLLAPYYVNPLFENELPWEPENHSQWRELLKNRIVYSPRFEQHMKNKYGLSVWGNRIFNGEEGIVFGYHGEGDNYKSLKFIMHEEGSNEFKVATKIKGLPLVPVVDTFLLQTGNVGGRKQFMCILSEFLNTNLNQYKEEIFNITNKIEEILEDWHLDHMMDIESSPPSSDVTKGFEVSSSISASDMNRLFRKLKNIFKITDGEPKDISEKVARDLLSILISVFEKTGFLTGTDWGDARNVGFNKSGNLVPFDFGSLLPLNKKAGQPLTGVQVVKI